MFFTQASKGQSPLRGVASRLALALALASSVVVSHAVIAPDAAQAQRRGRGAAEGGNSPEFAAAYTPVSALTAGEAPNWAAARDQFETLVAAIKNEDDRNIAGNFALQIGTNLSDTTWQRRGLEMMLQSGKVTPDRIGAFNFFVGNFAYQAREYAAARTALQAAIDAGYVDSDPRGLILESYFEEGNLDGGISYLETLIAGGFATDENPYLSALQATYDAQDQARSARVATMLVRGFPTNDNWGKALKIVTELSDFEPQEQLDMLRLMRATDTLTTRSEYLRYVYMADSRRVPDEVLAVLAEGLAAEHFTATGDEDYSSELATARSRSALDRTNMATILRDGERGDQIDAMAAGDVMLSQLDYARAEAFYRTAMTKGAESNLALTRIGMVQQLQGNNAGAIETLAQVTGVRQSIAQFWSLRAELQAGS